MRMGEQTTGQQALLRYGTWSLEIPRRHKGVRCQGGQGEVSGLSELEVGTGRRADASLRLR
jgi:hypothetical protein